MPKILLLVFVSFVAFAFKASAQSWELGASVGASGYIGDFNPNNPLKFSDVAYSALVKRNFNSVFSVKISVTHSSIQGNDSESTNEQMHDRNLIFFTSLDEISLTGELNFLPYIPQVGHNKFTPFIFAGIGNVKYNPQATYNGQDYDLRPLMTEGQKTPYKESAIVVPFGAGIKYNFTGAWNFIADLGYRVANTGYLDDVYAAYPDKTILTSNIAKTLSDRSVNGIGSPGSQRGNYHSDSYMFLGFTISYTFLSAKCYSFN